MSGSPIQVRRVTDDQIARIMTPADFVASCDEAFHLYGTGGMVNPPRSEEVTSEGGTEVFRLELRGEWTGRYSGRKVIEERSDVRTGRLGDREVYIELTDLTTGRQTVLDAGTITDMRTGAAGALGARYLGPRRARSVAIVGTGRVARALAVCVDAALGPEEIRATSRQRENREAFEAAVGPKVGAAVRMCDSIAQCVAGADAVLTAVPTPQPVLTRDSVYERTLVCAVAGDPRTNQLAADLMCSRTVVVDQADQARRSGDFAALERENRSEEVGLARRPDGEVATIGDAALGRLEALRGQGAICYLTGIAIQDIHAAATVLTRLSEKG